MAEGAGTGRMIAWATLAVAAVSGVLVPVYLATRGDDSPAPERASVEQTPGPDQGTSQGTSGGDADDCVVGTWELRSSTVNVSPAPGQAAVPMDFTYGWLQIELTNTGQGSYTYGETTWSAFANGNALKIVIDGPGEFTFRAADGVWSEQKPPGGPTYFYFLNDQLTNQVPQPGASATASYTCDESSLTVYSSEGNHEYIR
jgi:hypothetical protein